MAGDFSILAKVKVDVPGSNIQGQLDKAMASLNQGGGDAGLTFQAANAIFSKTIDIVSDMVEQVYALNEAQIEFQKVSDLSGDSLERYTDYLGELGETVARTTSSMVQSAANFRKAGFSDQDSATLAQISSMLQNVADNDLSVADATNFLVSQMTAFNFSAEESVHIVDAVDILLAA